jgi:hypothetical protein
MEHKLGEIFDYKNKKLKVVKTVSCEYCYFNYACTEEDHKILGECSLLSREDDTSVVFKEV